MCRHTVPVHAGPLALGRLCAQPGLQGGMHVHNTDVRKQGPDAGRTAVDMLSSLGKALRMNQAPLPELNSTSNAMCIRQVRAHAVKRLNDMQTAGKVAREASAHPAPSHLKKLNPAAAAEESPGPGPGGHSSPGPGGQGVPGAPAMAASVPGGPPGSSPGGEVLASANGVGGKGSTSGLRSSITTTVRPLCEAVGSLLYWTAQALVGSMLEPLPCLQCVSRSCTPLMHQYHSV